jgi:hypothetical protein
MMKKCVHDVPEHPSTLSPAQTKDEEREGVGVATVFLLPVLNGEKVPASG